MRRTLTLTLAALLLAGTAAALVQFMTPAPPAVAADTTAAAKTGRAPLAAGLEEAIFAGGCFWCVEADFDKVKGVVSTTSGYTGGHKEFPTYRQVSGKQTGHYEAVSIVFDPKTVTYAALLEKFWHTIDPTDPIGQFCDKGEPYKTAIFFKDASQEQLAKQSKAALERAGKLKQPIVTEIREAGAFWPAEAEHQDYHQKNPLAYSYYRFGCGRDERLRELWGDPPA